MKKKPQKKYCLLCKSYSLKTLKEITKKPSKETDFLIEKAKYKRIIRKCKTCGIFLNMHDYDLDFLYKKIYNQKTYENNLTEHFDAIMSLPFSKSDNKQRVERINNYFIQKSKLIKHISVLDIGSGLCVFLAELKKYYADVTCIDPSHKAIKHAKDYVGISNTIHGNFDDVAIDKKYDLITFNKVLEHVKNPVELLIKAKSLLNQNGCIYIELPDGDCAAKNGGFVDREEFYIEHYTIFTLLSFKYLVKKTGLNIEKVESIHESSDKYTIYGFLSI